MHKTLHNWKLPVPNLVQLHICKTELTLQKIRKFIINLVKPWEMSICKTTSNIFLLNHDIGTWKQPLAFANPCLWLSESIVQVSPTVNLCRESLPSTDSLGIVQRNWFCSRTQAMHGKFRVENTQKRQCDQNSFHLKLSILLSFIQRNSKQLLDLLLVAAWGETEVWSH